MNPAEAYREMIKEPFESDKALNQLAIIKPGFLYRAEDIRSILNADKIVIAAFSAGSVYTDVQNNNQNIRRTKAIAAVCVLCPQNDRFNGQRYNSYPVCVTPYNSKLNSLSPGAAEHTRDLALSMACQLTAIGHDVSFLLSNLQRTENGRSMHSEYLDIAKKKGIRDYEEPFNLCISQLYKPEKEPNQIDIIEPPADTRDPYILWLATNQILQRAKFPRTKDETAKKNLKNAAEAYLNEEMPLPDFYEYYTQKKYTRNTHQEYMRENR